MVSRPSEQVIRAQQILFLITLPWVDSLLITLPFGSVRLLYLCWSCCQAPVQAEDVALANRIHLSVESLCAADTAG